MIQAASLPSVMMVEPTAAQSEINRKLVFEYKFLI
jgi:hypothetical protein